MIVEQYYEILGIKPNASLDEVKKAYRNLAKTWHPDRFFNDLQMKQQAEEKIKFINQAYEILKSYISNSNSSASSTYSTKVTTQSIDDKFFYHRGVQKAENKEYSEAIDYFSKAINLNPKYVEAYEYRGKISQIIGRQSLARQDLDTAFRLRLEKELEQKKIELNNKKAASLKKYKITIEETLNVISCIKISQTKKFFVSGSWDNTIKIRELDTGKIIYSLGEHLSCINCICISSDEKLVASGSKDKTIQLWNLEKYELIRIFGIDASRHLSDVLCVAISFDSKILISGSADRTIKAWDLATGQEIYTLTDYTKKITSVAVSPIWNIFATASSEKHFKIRNISDGNIIYAISVDSSVLCLDFSANGEILATGCFDGKVKFWNVKTGQEINTLIGHSARVTSLNFSLDGETLVSGSDDGVIILWQVNTGQDIDKLEAHSREILSVNICPDRKTIITSSADRTIKIWQRHIE